MKIPIYAVNSDVEANVTTLPNDDLFAMKNEIDAELTRRGVWPIKPNVDLESSEMACVRGGDKIAAIKMIRARCRALYPPVEIGLKEAKELADQYENEYTKMGGIIARRVTGGA